MSFYIIKVVSGRVLTAKEINTQNTFDNPNAIKPEILNGIKIKKGVISANLPAKSVVVLKVKLGKTR